VAHLDEKKDSHFVVVGVLSNNYEKALGGSVWRLLHGILQVVGENSNNNSKTSWIAPHYTD
jgi:hypothetical protein